MSSAPEGITHLAIEGEMSIYRAAELKETVLTALGRSATLEIDLSGVSEFDSAGLQILILAKQTAQTLGRELRLVNHSHAVMEIFDMLDLAGYFGDALVMA